MTATQYTWLGCISHEKPIAVVCWLSCCVVTIPLSNEARNVHAFIFYLSYYFLFLTEAIRLSKLLRQPYDLYKPGVVDSFALGLVDQQSNRMDPEITTEVRLAQGLLASDDFINNNTRGT